MITKKYILDLQNRYVNGEEVEMDDGEFDAIVTKFEEENIINSFESNDKKRYFEISQQPHPHFICTKCHKVECVKKILDFNLEGYLIENIILKAHRNDCVIFIF